MEGFSGFPPGKQELISVPALFFSELLPRIDHLVELKVTLYCLWALQAQAGELRYVRFSEVCEDAIFLGGIASRPDDQLRLVRDGFERAVARGSLLHVHVTLEHGADDLYLMNTEKGRSTLQTIEKGEWLPDDRLRPIGLEIIRPTIYTIYEQSIGALTPMIAQQLQDAVQTYSQEWVLESIQIAVDRGVRKWSYMVAILERKLAKNKPQSVESREERLSKLEVEYADLIEKYGDE